MNGLSMFANVGIAETYLSQENINIVVANELLPERAKFYEHLYPECNMICGDITTDEIYKRVIEASKEQNVEFIIATPPCQGMSIAGKSDPDDPRNYLVTYAANAIRDLKPKFVLMENVFMQLKTHIPYKGQKLLIPDYLDLMFGNEYYIEKQVIRYD